ncbi:MAG: ABC transporter substrate-binding protein, partial [Candidatus Bathyarchaeia archaeon]
IVLVAIIAGIAYYFVSLPTPTTPTPVTPTPTTPTPVTPTPTTPTPVTPTPTTPTPVTPTPTTPTPTTPTPTTPIKMEIRIGAIFTLSGWAAFGGTWQLDGMKIAVKWVNDQGGVNFKGQKVPLKLIYYDYESKEDYAVQLTQKLITEDKVDLMMQAWGPFCVATVPVTEKAKIFSVLWAGAPDFLIGQGYKYAIAPHNPLSGHYYYALKLIHETDSSAKKVVNIYRAEPGAVLWGEAVRKYSPEFGLSIVYDKSYPPDISDFSPLLREIAPLKPDILCAGSTFIDGSLLVTQLRDFKINIKWVTMQASVNLPEFGETLGKWAAGFMIDSPYEPECKWEVIAAKEGKEYVGATNDEIMEYWRAAGGTKRPEVDLGMAASGIFVAVKCLEEAQSLDAEKLVATAKELDFYTCRGRFKIDPNEPLLQIGTPSPPTVAQWQRKGDKLVYAILYPYEFSNSIVTPMPTWEEKETWPELEPVTTIP